MESRQLLLTGDFLESPDVAVKELESVSTLLLDFSLLLFHLALSFLLQLLFFLNYRP